MLEIKGKNIEITRGNILPMTVTASNDIDKTDYEFQIGDILRFKVFDSNDVNKVYLQRDFKVEAISSAVEILIPAEDMRIGPLSNKPIEYWWEIDLNPDTPNEMTLVGYTLKEGPAILVIVPEGGNKQ